LKVVLVLVGLLFSAAVYPLLAMRLEEALRMMLSVYATLGIFLLLAYRDPSANRSLIAFTAWSSFAHATVMAVQLFYNLIPRSEALGVLVLGIIGVTLLVLAPRKPSAGLVSATAVNGAI
jgi:cellulose synthase/poly-beta-1,6-N-acetylglucosamine synthase-like glycosyltransferase